MRTSDTFGRRVGLGFVVVTLILAASVSLSLWKVSQNSQLNSRINEVRTPVARLNLQLLSSVNQSVAAFRGSLLYKDNQYKIARADAWKDIDSAYEGLATFGQRMDD